MSVVKIYYDIDSKVNFKIEKHNLKISITGQASSFEVYLALQNYIIHVSCT